MRYLIVLIAIAHTATACSCAPAAYAPLCQRIDAVRVLFIGAAVETNDNHDGFIKGGAWYRFTVEEAFKGVDSGTKQVIVDPASGTSCQEEFTIGKHYLVSSYGNALVDQQAAALTVGGFPPSGGMPRPKGLVVVTGVCSGSLEVGYAAADIAFVRRYLSSPEPARIFGFVRVHADEWLWSDRHPPLPGAALRADGVGGVRTAVTDQNGHYEIPNIEPGAYTLTTTLPGFASARPAYAVQVPAHGCGVANIGMFSDGAIEGKVVNQDGTPAKGVDVEYLYVNKEIDNPWFKDRSTKTNDEGEFRFTKVPPGDFLVGVHADSAPTAKEGIPPTYWPGTTAISAASSVHLAANEEKRGLLIKLGPRAGIRNVNVVVQWPDGRPAPSTNVSAQVNGKIAELGKTDAKGVITMPLLVGVSYTFSGRAFTSYGDVHGNKIPDDWVDTKEKSLAPDSSSAEVVLVLNKPRPQR